MNSQQLVHEIEVLPSELQKQVFDFVAFLKTTINAAGKQKNEGEYRNKISICARLGFTTPLLRFQRVLGVHSHLQTLRAGLQNPSGWQSKNNWQG